MKRKFLILVLSVITIFCLALGISACSGSNGDTSTGTTSDAAETENSSSYSSDAETSDSGSGSEVVTENLTYSLNSDGSSYTVTGIGTANSSTIEIPAAFNGLPVTAIAENAFKNNTVIIIIIIGDNVILIGDNAFYGCSSVTSVTFGSGVSSIGSSAFYGCSSLTSVNIPANVTSIGENAFANCIKLVIVVIPGNTQIGADAFKGCTAITDVTLSEDIIDKLMEIIKNAFPDSILIVEVKTDISIYHVHSLTHYEATEATCTQYGHTEYWYCTDCGNYYSDEYAVNSIVYGDTFIAKLSHNLDENGICTLCGMETTYDLAFTLLDDGTYSVSGIGTSSSAEIIIPATYKGIKVTAISASAFSGNTTITSVTIPEYVTNLGYNAFFGCSYLSEIYFYATEMDDLSSSDSVFYKAGQSGSGITVTIGANVTKIPKYLFYQYTTSYTPKITGVIFEEGSQCQSIGSNAFYYCSGITSITIPENITTIGFSAFQGCSSLSEIIFNATAMDDLAYGNNVFRSGGISAGIAVTIGANVTKIPAYLFNPYNTSTMITSVTFEKGSHCQSIGNYAFGRSTNLSSITIPDSVTYIGEYAFLYSYAEILWGDNPSLTEIGQNAFASYLGTAFTIPESVTYIALYAFSDCTNLTSIVIPDSVTYIYSSAFKNCTSLESVTLSDNLEEVTGFYGCTALKNITIPENITQIGEYAFYGCSSLESITIPENITSIGGNAFNGCTALKEINYYATEIADLYSTNNIFSSAGTDGDGITVTIGANVKRIPAYLFCPWYFSDEYAPNITSVIFEESSVCESIGSNAFYYCTSLKTVIIGENVTVINSYAFCECTSLESIYIPESVTSAGNYAFNNCTSLTSVYYGGTQEEWNAITFGSYSDPAAVNENTTVYYYDKTGSLSGSYWHYDANGNIVINN